MNLSCEIELMIACSRVDVDLQTAGRIQQLIEETIDWDQLIKLSTRHKVLPLVFQNLLLLCSGSFPENLKNQLENGYIFENALHNAALVEQLHFILELLKKNEILAVPFKGPVLAENVFGDFTLRRYLDLDLFISKKDAVCAVDILMARGFVPEDGSLPEGNAKKAYLDKLVNISLVEPGQNLSIDLQWDISNRFSNVPIVLEDVATRIEQVSLGQKNVPNLPPEELLCYLCLHGTKHRWLSLDLVCCVSELIRARKDIDWEYSWKYANRIHCTNVLKIGLCLARNLLGARLPDAVNRKIDNNRSIEPLVDKVYEGLFFNYRETMILPEKFDPFLFQIKDSFADKIRYLMKMLFIPVKEDLRAFPLPESLSCIRYLLRPLRLIKVYIKRILKNSG